MGELLARQHKRLLPKHQPLIPAIEKQLIDIDAQDQH
jgi:hypothetical protein